MSTVRASGRGFTLIELMIAVAIVGLLSSVALPNYQRMQMRSRASERTIVMESLARAVNDVVLQAQRIPLPPNDLNGDWNPSGVPGVAKRRIDWSVRGWKQLPLVIQGDAYYSYKFGVVDGSAASPPAAVTLTVLGMGDLDGDGQTSTRKITWYASGYSFRPGTGPDDDVFLEGSDVF